jgi:glycosyltransferase involved in cell wall biosynthesis
MILVCEQELPHYRVPVFAALAKHLREEIVVCSGEIPASSYHTAVDEDHLPFRHHVLKTWWLGGKKLYAQAYWQAFALFDRPDAVIVRHSIRNMTLFPLIVTCKSRGIPIVIWGQGYSRNRHFRPTKNLLDWLHMRIIRLADAYVCYTEEIRQEIARYAPDIELFVATNTLDTQSLLAVRRSLEAEGKIKVKQRLGLTRRHYLSFVGRLQPRKQVPYLLEVYRTLKNHHQIDIGLLLIGPGDLDYFWHQIAEAGLEDVHLLGFLSLEDAGEYLFASDVMVIPGWLGLAVNHAFVFGLPVVSQRFGEHLTGHAPEAAYVQHGQTGWFAQAGDQEDMVRGIMHILEHWQTYSENVSVYAERYLHIERMMEGFEKALARARERARGT